MIAVQKRGGVVPVVVPMVPFGSVGLGVIVVEFGVIVEESGVVLGDVVERLRERDRDERVVLVDGLLIFESVVVVVDVLGDVWSIVPIVPVVEPIVPVGLPIVPVVEPIVPVPVEPPVPPVVCAEAMAGIANAAAAIEIMIRM